MLPVTTSGRDSVQVMLREIHANADTVTRPGRLSLETLMSQTPLDNDVVVDDIDRLVKYEI